MRQLFLIFLMTFISNQVFSFDCNPVNLKSVYSSQSFVSDINGELILKLDKISKEKKFSIECLLSNIPKDGISIEYFASSSSPCSTGVPFQSLTKNDRSFVLNSIPIYTNFIKFKADENFKFKLTIKLEEPEQKANCNYFLNKRNSFENPVLYTDSIGLEIVISDCITGCDPYGNISSSVKWYEFEVLNDVFMEFIEQGSINFGIQYYGIKNNQIYLIKDQYFNDGIFIDVADFSSVRVGIYPKNNNSKSYSFRVKRYKYDVSCVDLIGDGDTLVYEGNMLQPGTPVFKGGDTVTFQYKLLSWVPIRQNWVHGLSIEYGDGWEGLEIDSVKGQPKLSAHSVDNGNESLIRLDYENDQDYFKLNNVNQGNLYVPGIYMNATNSGPKGPNSSFNWGNKLRRIKGDFNNPLVTFEFSLIAKDSKDCEVPLDGFVQVIPISDYFTGRHTKLACEETKGAEILAEIVCCESPALIANKLDTIFCEGQELFFSFKDTVEWKISEAVYGRGVDIHIKEYSNAKEIDSLNIVFKPIQNQYCVDSFSHNFYSVKRPNYNNLTKDNLCEHEQIDLTKLLKLKGDEIILDPEQFSSKIYKHSVSKDIEILDLIVQDTFGCEIPVKLEFISDPDCKKQLLTGYVNPNPMVNYSRLYVLNKTTDPEVKVIVLNSSKDVMDQFQITVPENYDGYFDFNSEHLYSGEYYINLSNSIGNYSFSFIKVN